MRLTRFSDNALRCLMFLGLSDKPISTVGEIARRMSMSEDHLLKVIKRLSQLGYVQTIRGRNGGLRLARSPEEINIADVIRSTEENLAIVPCLDGTDAPCPISSVCQLSNAVDEALNAFFTTLKRFTLADMCRDRGELQRVLASANSHGRTNGKQLAVAAVG
ncbi:MAG: Rrf2 family transcriptional regulator [Gemmatimonadaceae bacterium]